MEQYRRSPRAFFLNYQEGDYFVTICTKDKLHYFGKIYDGEMHLSAIGKFAYEQLSLTNHFNNNFENLAFVVMPNHIHAIFRICGSDNSEAEPTTDKESYLRNPDPYYRGSEEISRRVSLLSRYVSSFKGAVTKFAKNNNIEFAWQKRYHDHLIRNNHDGNNIVRYILNNVAKWEEDRFNR